MFNTQRLSLARRRRGMTKKGLADAVGCDPRSITAFEGGEYPPADEMLKRLAGVLDFPVAFFAGDDLEEPAAATASFRAMSRMPAKVRHSVLAAGTIAFAVSDWVERRFSLPSADLPDFRGETPDAAAAMLRHYWGLGERPVRNMVHMLEAKGVRVFSLVEERREVDAYSLWRGGRPYIFLNTFKSAERSRFDAAHELGHLLLHKHGGPGGQDAERDAHAFASALLMPEGTVRSYARTVPTVRELVALKGRWGVSVAALARRLHDLNIISEWHYRTICIQISELGYFTREPAEGQRETSQVWAKVFSALRSEGMGKLDLAESLQVSVTEIEKLVFGLVMMGVSSDAAALVPSTRPRADLKLVGT